MTDEKPGRLRGLRARWQRVPPLFQIVVIAGVPLMVILIALGVANSRSSEHSNSDAANAASISKVTGSQQDWIKAVCPSGRASQPPVDASGDFDGGACLPSPGQPDASAPAVFYGQFYSDAEVASALQVLDPVVYSAGRTRDGGRATVFYVLSEADAQALLAPLGKFGFQVTSGS